MPRTRQLSLVLGVATASALLLPGTAVAHVSVSPATVAPGGFGTFSLKVPTERDDASTTRVELVLPNDLVLTSLSVRPVPGWTSKLTYRPAAAGRELVPAGVVWAGGSIGPGQFQVFDVSMGRLPTTEGVLALKALQTYSSGEVVRWIDVAAAGAPEPEHPAPSITVVAPVSPVTSAAPVAEHADTPARLLGGAGLAAGLSALVLALRRRRLPSPASPVAGPVLAPASARR